MDKIKLVEIFHIKKDPNSNVIYINTEARFMPPDDPAGVEKKIAETSMRKCGYYIDKEDKFKRPVFRFSIVDTELAMRYRNEPENQIQNPENDSEN